MKQVMLGYRVGKKTNKRKKQMESAKKNITKEKKKSKSAWLTISGFDLMLKIFFQNLSNLANHNPLKYMFSFDLTFDI